MAITPRAEDPAFLREVSEELRRDQMEGLVRRHGRTAILVAIVLLVVLGGALFWNAHRAGAKEDRAEQLNGALADLSSGAKAKATPVLASLAAGSDPGYRSLALMTQADAAVEAGNDQAAIALYKQVVAGDDFAQPVRDLARVREAATGFDSMKPADVIALLAPLAQPGNPWFGSAGEMTAMAYRAEGQTAPAGKLFATLAKDAKIPDSIRQRATQMAASMGIDVGEDAGAGNATAATGGDGK